MTREEAAHIVDVAFGVPQAVRRIGEDKTYCEDEIREAKDMAIKALEQEPKTGHWIWSGGSHRCSNCNGYTCFDEKHIPNYCPNCGAKMEVEE